MNLFFEKNKNHYIESLEFFYFLQELYTFSIGIERKSSNPLILNFLKIFEGFYLLESKKNNSYLQILTDHVFWESNEFYREMMQKFVSGKLNTLEFAEEFLDRLLADRKKANDLVEDFQKQVNIELNPNIFQFSKIILDFELVLEVYLNEIDELEIGELSENDLSFTHKSLLEGIKLGLEKIDKYFTD